MNYKYLNILHSAEEHLIQVLCFLVLSWLYRLMACLYGKVLTVYMAYTLFWEFLIIKTLDSISSFSYVFDYFMVSSLLL